MLAHQPADLLTPDPMKPNVLIYEPVKKKLKLVAVEWLVRLTADTKKRPALFDRPFIGPMEGHEPLIPKEYVHYDLHAWLFKNKPLGMFAPTNPDVSCEGYDFSLPVAGEVSGPEHVVVVRVYDRYDNLVSAKTVITGK